jgi:hypothetical protein
MQDMKNDQYVKDWEQYASLYTYKDETLLLHWSYAR